MATLEELVVKLTAETSGLKAELASAAKTTEQSVGKMQSSLDDLAKSSSKNLGFFQTSLATLAGFLAEKGIEKSLELIKEAAAFLGEQLLEGAKGAIQQEAAFQKLADSLALAGHYSKDAQGDLQDFSDTMEHLTGVDNAVIASNLSLLESITKLDSEGLKQAEKAALAVAQAYDMDLESAVRLVGKAIDGHGERLQVLIPTLTLTGDKVQNLASLIAAVPWEAALAKTNTFAGATKLLDTAYDNLLKTLGATFVTNPVVVAMINELTKTLFKMEDAVKMNSTTLKEEFANVLISVTGIVGDLLKVIDLWVRGWEASINILLIPLRTLIGTWQSLHDLASGQITNPFEEVKKSLVGVNDAIQNESAFGKLGDTLNNIGQSGQDAFGKIKNSADAAEPSIGKNVKATKELTEAQKAYNEATKAFAESLASSNRDIDSQYKFRSDVIKHAADTDKAVNADNFNTMTENQLAFFQVESDNQAAQFEAENAALENDRANKLISEQTYQDAKTALAQKQLTDSNALDLQRTQFEVANQKTRAQNLKDSFSYIATLSTSGNATLAAIGKAAAITTATIDGYAAVQKALAAAPPPFNFALAALVGTATAANVAKIAGVGLASGITEVPASARGGNSGDNFPAILQSGERVVDSQTNQDLKSFLANNGAQAGGTITINVSIAPGTGMTSDQCANLIEQLNNYVTAGGLRLV